MVNLDRLVDALYFLGVEWKMEAGDSDLTLRSDDKHACSFALLPLLLADCMVSISVGFNPRTLKIMNRIDSPQS